MTGTAAYILLKKETSDINTRIDNLPKAFVPQGSIAFANLPEQPSEDKLGYIWNITDDFTTDSRFIEGAGKSYPAGNNVACIKHDNAYYYDVMSVIDLSNYYTKVEVNDLLQAEANDRTTADSTLQTNINNEATTRESADNVLTTDLQTEVERATQAEAVIQGNLDSEITTRTNADLGLHNEITTEAAVRESADNTKVDKQVSGTSGTAYIFNESDGGGAKFENNSGIESFVGVHDGGTTSDGIAAQIYADKYENGSWNGAKLDITNNGIYYTVGNKSASERDVEANLLAVKGDVTNESTLRANADTTLQNNIDIEVAARTTADSTLETNKLNILPTVEDPTDPGYGYPYWIPYSFATNAKADGLDITLKTLTLDNTLRKMNFTNAFPVVNTTQAGIMTAADKVSLDGKQNQLTAGTNIQIANNVISATDTKYTVTIDV